jgi:hypothetical protein
MLLELIVESIGSIGDIILEDLLKFDADFMSG